MPAFGQKSKPNPSTPSSFNARKAEDFFGVQAKLNIGKSNDKYEVEADNVADKIVSNTSQKAKDSFFSPSPVVQKKINEVGKKYETENVLQEKSIAENITPVVQLKLGKGECIQNKIESQKQKGKALNSNVLIQQKKEEDLQKKNVVEKIDTSQSKTNADTTESAKTKEKIITPQPQIQKKEAEDIQAKEEEEIQAKEGEKKLQMNATSDVAQSDISSLESKLNGSKSGGIPLSGNIKNEMESGFGADFSNIRIHNNSDAVQMNQQLGSQAFATGNNIYFNEGRYNPNSQGGKHLLAHELTHTIQQGASKNIQTKKFPALNHLGQNLSFLQKSTLDNQENVTQFYKTGDASVIQQFNPLDIVNSLSDISEYLNITLPEGPIEALELLISTMENDNVRIVFSIVPGYYPSLILLKTTLEVIKTIDYILRNKEKIIQEIMHYIEGKLDTVQDIVREKLEEALGTIDDRHFSIIWNVHLLPMLVHLKDNWQETVTNALWEQIWPFEGLTSVLNPEPVGLGKNLVAIWNHISGAFSNLSSLELSRALDDILMIGKELTALTNRFYGWAAIYIIASETLIGAGGLGAITGGTGTLAGAAVGFGAGLASAGVIGEFLLGATIGFDLLVILKSALSLHDVDSMLVDENKMRENNIYYGRIAQSTISTGLMLAFLALAYLAGAIAGAFLSKISRFLPEGFLEILEHIKTGMRDGRPGNSDLEPPNVRETPPELNAEFNALREKINNPENIRRVSDSELASKYDVEVSVGEHTYRRRITDGRWCRFSTAVCGLEIEGVNSKIDENIPDPVIDFPVEIQIGEQLTIPIQGARRAQVVSIRREVYYGTEFTMYELRIMKDSRRGFDSGSTMRVSNVTLRKWLAEGRAIRWTQERSRLMRTRPEYRDGLVNDVWEASKGPDGRVRDPHDPDIELHWDRNRSRYDQWHMGHKPGHEYYKLVDRYVEGQISWDQFIAEYNNPNFYHAEDPIGNMGHGHETP